MNPFIADARKALQCAGYHVQEEQRLFGLTVTGARRGNNRPYFTVFGRNPEEAYLRACQAAEVGIPGRLRME